MEAEVFVNPSRLVSYIGRKFDDALLHSILNQMELIACLATIQGMQSHKR